MKLIRTFLLGFQDFLTDSLGFDFYSLNLRMN